MEIIQQYLQQTGISEITFSNENKLDVLEFWR